MSVLISHCPLAGDPNFDVCTACLVKDDDLLTRARTIFDAHGAAQAAKAAQKETVSHGFHGASLAYHYFHSCVYFLPLPRPAQGQGQRQRKRKGQKQAEPSECTSLLGQVLGQNPGSLEVVWFLGEQVVMEGASIHGIICVPLYATLLSCQANAVGDAIRGDSVGKCPPWKVRWFPVLWSASEHHLIDSSGKQLRGSEPR